MARQPPQPPRSNPTGSTVDRIEALVEGLRDETRAGLERVQSKVQETNNRVEMGQRAASDDLAREISNVNVRLDRFHDAAMAEIGKVRQELHDHEKLSTSEAARGAAGGAVAAMAPVVTEAARSGRSALTRRMAWAVAISAFVAGFSAIVDGVPKVLRFLQAAWIFLAGRP